MEEKILLNVKKWYIGEYQKDDLGEMINENITFQDIFDTLDRYGNIYKAIGVGDSVVRERIFKKLAEIIEVDYDYIYEQWLKCE